MLKSSTATFRRTPLAADAISVASGPGVLGFSRHKTGRHRRRARFPRKSLSTTAATAAELKVKQHPALAGTRARPRAVEMRDSETCCGSRTFSAKFPAISTAMGEVNAPPPRDGSDNRLERLELPHANPGPPRPPAPAHQDLHPPRYSPANSLLKCQRSSRQFKTDAKRSPETCAIGPHPDRPPQIRGLARPAKSLLPGLAGCRSRGGAEMDAINHLDAHLESFASKLEARGTKVHWASTGEQARQIILGIVREKGPNLSSNPRR